MKKFLILFALIVSLFGFVEVGDPMGPKIVPVDEAYKASVAVEGDRLVVRIKMAPKVYLYKRDIKLIQLKPQRREIPLQLPKPMLLHGEEVYEGELEAVASLSELSGGMVELELSYQGCSELGICYPPQKKRFTLTIPKTEAKSESTSTQSQTNERDSLGEEQRIVSILKNANLFVILGTFFLLGLTLAFTPCVFPMIPILSSLIVGSKNMNTKKAFFYSLVYVLAMALTYTVAGVLAGLFGSNLQAAFQHPVVVVLFAAVFVALALSMFGFYEIGLPASIQTMIAKKSDEAGSRGGVVGVAIMGFLSALIVGPCVAPPLAGALIYIGQTGDALLGGAALFVMSLGMGVPLLLIGTGSGKYLPKPGGWMTVVNKVFGVVMLAMAIWLLSRVLPASVTMLLWAALFIASAVYMRALESIPPDAHWFVYLKKSLGLMLFLYGVLLFVGALGGSGSLLRPLEVFRGGMVVKELGGEVFKEIENLQELETILKTSRKPVVVDVTAKWCTSCKELEEFTFSDPRVKKILQKDFAAYKLDVTDNSDSDKEFLRHFDLFGPPAILIFKDGKEVRRIVGFKSAEDFLTILKEVQ